MNNLIVEKKFITSSSSQKLQSFRQVKQKLNTIPSYSTIFYDRENTQSIQSELKQNSKQYLSCFNQPYNHKPENDSDALTYSHTGSMLLPGQTLPLLKSIITLLNSKQHIASHVSHSLGVKGYKSELSTEVGKIVANSFGEYINIAQIIASKLSKEQPNQQKQDKFLSLNRDLASLNMQNAKLFQKNTKLEQENHMLKRRFMRLKKQQIMSNESLKQDISNYEKEISIAMSRMNTFQSEVYRRLTVFQNMLIQVSNFRNQIMMNTSNIHQCQKHKQKIGQLQKVIQFKDNSLQMYVLKDTTSNKDDTKRQNNLLKTIAEQKAEQCDQLKKELAKLGEQLSEQKKMYDQMLDKNISLQKQLYFVSFKEQNEEQPSESMHIVQETPVTSKQYQCVEYIHQFCTHI